MTGHQRYWEAENTCIKGVEGLRERKGRVEVTCLLGVVMFLLHTCSGGDTEGTGNPNRRVLKV